MVARSVDRAVEGLARRQHGVFHRRQALLHGADRGIISRRLAAGTWVRLGGKVFALPSHPGTWHRQCMAAVLSLPACAVTGAAAAHLWQVPQSGPGPIEVSAPRGANHRNPFARVRERSAPARLHIVDGIRVVGPTDCVLDLARSGAPPDRVERAIDHFTATNAGFLADLRERFADLGGSRRPGGSVVEDLLTTREDAWVPPTSELERHLRSLLVDLMDEGLLPPVRFEAHFPWRTDTAERVDALVQAWWLIVEADGRRWHTRVADFERDRRRDNEAAVHGYHVLRLTWHQLTEDRAGCRRLFLAYGARVAAQRRHCG